MSRGGLKHPPKKKHTAKPRPLAQIPLTDSERLQKTRAELDKSMIYLLEAERLASWGQAPNACIHSAYFAMLHCARAIILACGGVGKTLDVPNSHEHVIQHFGNVVAKERHELAGCGLMLNRARGDRMIADYDLVRTASPEDAAQTTADARRFIDSCKQRWQM